MLEAIVFGRYSLGELLGSGSFAEVRIGNILGTNSEVALKIKLRDRSRKADICDLGREGRIIRFLKHPNIVKVYELIENEHVQCLVLELVRGCTLFKFLMEHGRFQEDEGLEVFEQILSAVDFCHRNNIVHRDLKDDNILLDINLNIKLIDFGLSSVVPDGKKLVQRCGSLYYQAPELFTAKQYDGYKVDVWSLGVIFYTILTKHYPFFSHNFWLLRDFIIKGNFKIPKYISKDCTDFLTRMLVVDPQRRPTVNSLLNTCILIKQNADKSAPLSEGFSKPLEYASSVPPSAVLFPGLKNMFEVSCISEGSISETFITKYPVSKDSESFRLQTRSLDDQLSSESLLEVLKPMPERTRSEILEIFRRLNALKFRDTSGDWLYNREEQLDNDDQKTTTEENKSVMMLE